jgi:alanyl-tRNA synthetase
MVAVLQNVSNNFETDLILPIIKKTEDLSEKQQGELEQANVAMKVIADHSRAAAFLIGDGVFPSNEGRGYVLRRIMRRAIRYGRNIGLTKPFLHQTAKVVFDIMKPAYPELAESAAFITNVIQNEEMRFTQTLDTGLKLLNDTLAELKVTGQKIVPGQVIFKLYDTYGFPVDIVSDVVRDEDLTLDMAGFEKAMGGQRAQSRSVANFTKVSDAYKILTAEGFQSVFVGYDQAVFDSKVVVLVENAHEVSEAVEGSQIEVVTEATPFYAEAGGQVGDKGKITADGLKIWVTDTIKDPTGLIIHKSKIISGRIKKGQTVTLMVDMHKRKATMRNHTATHVLHAVLRSVLGDHVKQAGSLVAPDRLRFDFSHFSQIDPDTLNQIETLVNERIRENINTITEEMNAEKAFKSGATALFEEKYGDRVRVVSLSDFSKELCGGTHIQRTGGIGLFKIVAESSVASGIRRIEALTGEAAVDYAQQMSTIVQESSHLLKDKPEALPQKIKKVLSDLKSLEKEVERLKSKMAALATDTLEEEMKTVKGIHVLAKKVRVDTPAALRILADRFKEKIKSGVVVLGSINGPKVLLIVVVTRDLVKRYHAGNIVKQVAAIVGGGGGGRPDMAQAGGSRPEKLDEALDKVYEVIEKS